MRNLQEISIQYVKGVGPARKKLFSHLSIETVEDFFYFFPRRYEDRRRLTPITQLKIGEPQTVSGKILTTTGHQAWYTKKHVFEIVMDDGTGRLSCLWFNQPYLERYFRIGKKIVCFGKADMYKNRLQMISPEYEVIGENEEDEFLSLGRIVPIYPLTRGMTQRSLRKTMKASLDRYLDYLRDELPVSLRNKHKLYNIKRSLLNLHFPGSFEDQEQALRRVSFEEFYFFQLSVILRRLSITHKPGIKHNISDALALQFVNSFPFELTAAQKQAIREIREDMEDTKPMLRLLQGDVGSGKTLVALFGCAASFVNGYQSCIMAPTEILVRQHFENIQALLSSGPWVLSLGPTVHSPKSKVFPAMRAALLTSGMKKSEKVKLLEQIQSGDIDLVIGTHALIEKDVQFKNLSFIVVDEQHKFGVRQRSILAEKGINPDILIMTATPIPRTLCITLYGDLDVSIINELPPGRGKIKTVLYDNAQAGEAYRLVKEKLKQGRQAYIVYPIIEESAKLDLKAAEKMFKQFQKEEFKDFRVGLVHGQLHQKETKEAMGKFKNKELDVLVATTVVEVGVDVPNASVMVIEHAGRFGLAQLHQLRGRIGRGKEDALCILISDSPSEEGRSRLKAILSTTDGFKIAEEDLLIRGPGQFFGRHQHGLNELKVANPVTQLDILELARKEAIALTKEDPQLEKPAHQRIKEVIQGRYPTYLSMVTAG